MKTISLFFCLACLGLLQTTANAQEWVSYQSPQQVNDLVDTGDELLLATDAGLVVLNKSTLESSLFNKANSSLSNSHIQTIAQDADGNTWVGTYDVVLGRFDGTDFQDITLPQSPALTPNTMLYDLEIAPNGDLWLGTSDGVFHRQGQNWQHYDETQLGMSFFEAWDIEINPAGEVLVGSNAVFQFADGVWTNVTETANLSGYLHAVLFHSSSGALYFAGDLEALGRFDGNTWERFEFDDPAAFDVAPTGHQIIGFAEDEIGNVYLNTQNEGIFKLENGLWTQQTDAFSTFFGNRTDFFHIDADNQRWLNNRIHLAVDENGSIETTRIAEHTLETNQVYQVRKAQNGALYFLMSTKQNLAVRLPDGNWTTLALPADLSLWGFIGDVLALDETTVWIASSDGLYQYDGSEWLHHDVGPCAGLAADAQGVVYARAQDRIYRIENGEFTEYNTGNSPLATGILSGHGVDSDGNLWVAAMYEGMIQKRTPAGTWTSYTAAEYPAIEKPAGDFFFDSQGRVWIPDDVAGVIRFDGQTWSNPILDVISTIDNYSVFDIAEDAEGKLYFAHHYGVTTLLDGVWQDLLIEEVPHNFSFDSNIEFDDNGTLWWGGSRHGVFTYTPEFTVDNPTLPAVQAGLRLFPNPASTLTTLQFEVAKAGNARLLLYTGTGRLLQTQELGEIPAGDFQHTLALEALPAGLYVVQVMLDGRSFVGQVLVE